MSLPDTIEIDGQTLHGRGIILATGSMPALPPIPGRRDAEPLTNETVFQLARRPTSIAIIGGGASGCELGQAFARLGTRITILEAAPRVLASEEPETSALITDVLRAEGIDVRIGVTIATATRDPSGEARVTLGDLQPARAARPRPSDLPPEAPSSPVTTQLCGGGQAFYARLMPNDRPDSPAEKSGKIPIPRHVEKLREEFPPPPSDKPTRRRRSKKK